MAPAKNGPALRLERLRARAKQTDVSLATGISRFRLNQIESGSVDPAPEEVRAIREAIAKLEKVEAQRQAILAGKA